MTPDAIREAYHLLNERPALLHAVTNKGASYVSVASRVWCTPTLGPRMGAIEEVVHTAISNYLMEQLEALDKRLAELGVQL